MLLRGLSKVELLLMRDVEFNLKEAKSGSCEESLSPLNVRQGTVNLGLVEHQQVEASYLPPQLSLPSKVEGTVPFYFILPSPSHLP